MFSLFIREKVCDTLDRYSNLRILTTLLRSSTSAKPAGPSFLASSLVGQILLYLIIPSTGSALALLELCPLIVTYHIHVPLESKVPAYAWRLPLDW